MDPKSWGIFRFVEFVFLSGILINLGSYLVRFYIIYKNKHTKTFLRTVKEGFSKQLIVNNALNFSLLLTSLSVFWFILHISQDLKPLSMTTAFKLNPFIAVYVILASIVLLGYSIYLSIINVQKLKKLTPTLGALSLWNSADQFVASLGAKPIQDISVFFRKNLIQTKLSEVLVSTLFLIIFEYIYKILIVVGLLYLIAGNNTNLP